MPAVNHFLPVWKKSGHMVEGHGNELQGDGENNDTKR